MLLPLSQPHLMPRLDPLPSITHTYPISVPLSSKPQIYCTPKPITPAPTSRASPRFSSLQHQHSPPPVCLSPQHFTYTVHPRRSLQHQHYPAAPSLSPCPFPEAQHSPPAVRFGPRHNMYATHKRLHPHHRPASPLTPASNREQTASHALTSLLLLSLFPSITCS